MAGGFYFHCENETLKYNHDYQSLLKTLGVLEAQKMQAIKDLELLEELQIEAQADPLAVLDKLKEGSLVLPKRQTLANVSEIDWDQYKANTPSSFDLQLGYNTRKKRAVSPTAAITPLIEDKPLPSNEPRNKKTKEKLKSHGQLWTEEEQSRLEELLQLYPPEEVEAKRWQKIANALGNRTPKQVCCRVQKYFIKLAKAGLPIPGRIPNLAAYGRKGKIKRSTVKRSSLFLNSLKPRVYMTSADDKESSGDDESYVSLPSSPIDGKTCSGCGTMLSSTYWECLECKSTVLLCHQCVSGQWSNSSHLPSHELKEASHSVEKDARKYVDQDYAGFNPSLSETPYNYLDSNFRPAL